jgi:hypothetical protein
VDKDGVIQFPTRMIWALAAAFGLVLSLAVPVLRRMRLYSRMSSEAHFREVYERFAAAVQTVTEVLRAPASAADAEAAGDAFVTSAQLAMAVTASLTNGRHVLHVSLSQTSGYTTTSAASRFGFFLITMLNRNKLELDLFVTPSRVHHLVFSSDLAELRIADFASVDEQYRRDYRPLPYAPRRLT